MGTLFILKQLLSVDVVVNNVIKVVHLKVLLDPQGRPTITGSLSLRLLAFLHMACHLDPSVLVVNFFPSMQSQRSIAWSWQIKIRIIWEKSIQFLAIWSICVQ